MKSPFTSRAASGAGTLAPTLPVLPTNNPWLFPLMMRRVSDQTGPQLSIMNPDAVETAPANCISPPSFQEAFCLLSLITQPPFVESPTPTISIGLETPIFTVLPLTENGFNFAQKSAKLATIVFQSSFFNWSPVFTG